MFTHKLENYNKIIEIMKKNIPKATEQKKITKRIDCTQYSDHGATVEWD